MIRYSKPKIIQLLAVAGSLVVVGSVIKLSQADTLTVSAEAETGNVVAPAVATNDTAASGGQAVKFGAGTQPPPQNCTNPVFQTSDPNGGWSDGGYYVHNNMWNNEYPLGPETLFACSYRNWYVVSNQVNNDGAVKTYPNVHKDYNNMDGVPLSSLGTLTSTFAGSGPRTGIYNLAYDLWLNGVGWGGGTTEYMIWTENFGQTPLGSSSGTVTFGGMTYTKYHFNDGDANVITLVATTTMPSGSLNLKEMIDWAIGQGWIPANPTVNQIGFGVEIVSTDGKDATFTFSDFSIAD